MKIYFILLIFIVFLFILIGCSPTTITINENNLKEDYSIKKGDLIEVILSANPSTGYKWEILTIDTIKVKTVDETYTAKVVNENIVGSGGSKIYLFEAINKGKTIIRLKYFRPFEKDLPPRKQFDIKLEIR